METDSLKAFWQTLFRQLHHLKTLKDTIKIMYLQELNCYIKNAQSTRKVSSNLLKFCISLQYKGLKVKCC